MNDLISRQVAIDALKETDDVGVCWKGGYVQRHSDFEEAINCIKELPSAEPERKKGKWIKISPANIYECSVCHQNVMTEDIEAYLFCHHCGADMRGSE